jgi:hypothetical protein
MYIGLEQGETGWVWGNQSGPGSTIFAYDYCADSGDDSVGVVYSEWSFLGWYDAFGLTLTPPEGQQFPVTPMTLQHGTEAAGIGQFCENCGGGGGGGGGNVNTNQFHLDVTNQLSGLSNVLSESHRWQRGALSNSERSEVVGGLTNQWAGIEVDARARAAETLGSATNLAQLTPFSAPAADSDDFFVGSIGLLGLLESTAAGVASLILLFRKIVSIAMCFWLGMRIRDELHETAREMVTIPHVPAAGSGVPFMDLVVGKLKGFLIVSVLMAALPLLFNFVVGTALNYGLPEDVAFGTAARNPMPVFSSLVSAIPKFGRVFAFVTLFVPFETAMGCAVTYTVFRNLRLQVFIFACWWTKML